MVNAATLGKGSGSNTTVGGTGQTTNPPAGTTNSQGRVPFARASYLHTESTGYDQQVPLLNSTQLPVMFLPASGYLRNVVIRVDIVTVGGTPTLAADGPWNVFTDFSLLEPNGFPIVSVPSGFSAYLINKYGGYQGFNDPRALQGFVTPAAGTAGTTTFLLRVPVEAGARDGLGALPNQSSSAQFQFRMALAPLATVFSSAPTSATIRVRSWIETWLQPANVSLGQAQNTEPPGMDTTQYWTQVAVPLVAGQNNIQHQRLGNEARMFIYVFRDVSGVRQESQVFPISQLELDGNPLDNVDDFLFQARITERWGYGPGESQTAAGVGGTSTKDILGGQDSGVRPYDFAHDWTGRVGFETRNNWLYTLTTSRLRLNGVAAAAGQLQIITNDLQLPGSVYTSGS